jgi:hypothetical protein
MNTMTRYWAEGGGRIWSGKKTEWINKLQSITQKRRKFSCYVHCSKMCFTELIWEQLSFTQKNKKSRTKYIPTCSNINPISAQMWTNCHAGPLSFNTANLCPRETYWVIQGYKNTRVPSNLLTLGGSKENMTLKEHSMLYICSTMNVSR